MRAKKEGDNAEYDLPIEAKQTLYTQDDMTLAIPRLKEIMSLY